MKLAERTRRYLTKLTEAYRSGGVSGVFGVGAGTFGYLFHNYVFDSSEFILLRHSGEEESIEPALVPITVRIIDSDYLDEIARLNGFGTGSFQYRRLQRFFRLGNECFGAFHDGALICCGWGLHQADYYRAYALRIRPDPNEVVLSGAFTAPHFRGLHVRECLLGHQINHYCSRGIYCIGAIHAANKASLRVYSRYHFDQYGTIRKLRILGFWVK